MRGWEGDFLVSLDVGGGWAGTVASVYREQSPTRNSYSLLPTSRGRVLPHRPPAPMEEERLLFIHPLHYLSPRITHTSGPRVV